MATLNRPRPSWYTDEDDSAWDRIKAAFQRDWKQTKHDFGGDEPDLNQNVGDTVSQATGNAPIPPGNVPTRPEEIDNDDLRYSEEDEPAYRYGYAAYRHFGKEGCWCDETESRLRSDWQAENWDRQRRAVQRGWRYAEEHPDR